MLLCGLSQELHLARKGSRSRLHTGLLSLTITDVKTGGQALTAVEQASKASMETRRTSGR